MPARALFVAFVGCFALSHCFADDVLYRYEGNVSPCDESAGWICGNPCEAPCSDSVENGHFVLRWWEYGDLVNHHLWIAEVEDPPPPPTLWVEWRFRSNNPIPQTSFTCDAWFTVDYREIHRLVFMFADAVVSASGNHFVLGLDPNEFHSFRFESLDGVNYRFSVDGFTFSDKTDNQADNGSHFLQLGGRGGCNIDLIPRVNEWDFVRYGTISTGEFIIASDPPAGFLDPVEHAGLDRFTVTFNQPNYVYIEQIAVETSASPPPVVLQTRRRENDGPETVEIVLDRPLPIGVPIRFIFNDGAAINYVEYNSGGGIAGPIPTVSHWGLTILALLLAAVGTIWIRRVRPRPA